MADLPIIFSAPMVQALLDGRKSQTRREIKPRPIHPECRKALFSRRPDGSGGQWAWWFLGALLPFAEIRLRYAVGDRLYVREAHALVPASAYRMSEGVEQAIDPSEAGRACVYRAGFDRSNGGIRWRSPIHMPRWASRLTLTVTDVRVERLQEISEADAQAEGFPISWDGKPYDPPSPQEDSWQGYGRASMSLYWNSLHGPDAWAANPWVAAISFTVSRGNIDGGDA